MAIVNQYRIWCDTDSKWVTTAGYQDPAPTTCPENNTHAIDTAKTTIVDSMGDDGPATEDGTPIVSTSFSDSQGLDPKWEGQKYVATAGALSIFDLLITTEKKLRGGWYQLMKGSVPHADDYIEFGVYDKDDVLGLFATYGLTVGVDVLELKKYVIKDYTDVEGLALQTFKSDSVFTIAAGLYLRSIYNSLGGTDVPFRIRMLTYE